MRVSSIALLASAISAFPYLLPRGGSFSVNTIHNPKYTAHGPSAKAKAMAKYAHLVESSAGAGAIDYASPSGAISGFAEQNDREWLCPVTIGTPAQVVNLDLDTGSADLWVFTPDSNSKKGALGDRLVYDPSNSSTSRLVNDSAWSITYGDGSYAGGKVYTDTIEIAGLRVVNATVEVASSYSSNLVKDDAPLSGLMGLAINLTTTAEPSMPPFLNQLTSQGIGHIAVDLQYHSNGTYNFGALDSNAYKGAMTYQSVKPGKGYWWIDVTTMRLPGKNQTMVHTWDMIVDTGTSLFLGPEDIVTDYYESVPSAEWSDGDDAYVFHCNETLPDFSFGFADSWAQFIVPGTFMNYSAAPAAGGPWCYGGIQESNMPFSIMGDVFLKAVYVDFNIANQSVGFASKQLMRNFSH